MNVQIYLTLLATCCCYALLRGGAPERLGVLILVSAVVASSLTPKMHTRRFEGLEMGLLIVDTIMLIVVVALALRAQRYWPMWWAAVKLNSIGTHLLMLAPTLMPWPYSIASAAWSYPSPVLLAIGAWRHRERIRRYGSDPAWS